MRVLQFVQKPQRRGAEIFAFQLSGALRRLGHEVSTIYLYPYDGDTPLDVLPGDRVLQGAERSRLEVTLGHNPALLREVCDAIDDSKPDIVQVNGARTVKYGALARRRRSGAPWRRVYRNIDHPAYWATDPIRRWFYRRRIFPWIEGTVGVSQATLDEVVRMYGLTTPTVFVPNGFDPEPLDAAPAMEEARERLGVSLDRPLMLFMGNLTEQKRPDRFLRVFSRVKADLPTAEAWMLGSGPLADELKQQARELSLADSIRFLGYQKDVAPYIAACDVLVVTSDSDGIPAVVLESAYLGKPAVVTRVGGLHECVVEGETGFLVDPRDEEGLAGRVKTVLNDDEVRRGLGDEARRYAVDNFTIEAVGKRYLEFYERVIDQARTGR